MSKTSVGIKCPSNPQPCRALVLIRCISAVKPGKSVAITPTSTLVRVATIAIKRRNITHAPR